MAYLMLLRKHVWENSKEKRPYFQIGNKQISDSESGNTLYRKKAWVRKRYINGIIERRET